MFCNQCGTKLPDDARFCVNCGNSVAAPNTGPAAPAFSKAADLSEPAKAPVQSQTPVQPQAPVYSQPAAPAAPAYNPPAAPVRPTPTYTAAAPAKKKSGINWKVFIIMLLIGALIIGAGGFLVYNIIEGDLFGSSNTGRNNKDDDDDDDDDDKKDRDDKDEDEDEDEDENQGQADAVNPYSGWNQYGVNGLVFYLPSEFEVDEIDEEEAYFYSDDYDIEVACGPMSDIDSDISTSEEFAQMLMQSAPEEYKVEYGSSYGVSYLVMYDTDYDEYMIVGFYVNGDTGWIISAYGDADADVQLLIDCVTSGSF